MLTIRPFAHEHDSAVFFDIWQQALAPTWPMHAETFRLFVVDPAARGVTDCFVAEEVGAVAGFIVTQIDSAGVDTSRGNLVALVVAPAFQRQGVGAALHAHALDYLAGRGVRTVKLGGGGPWIWAGVPTNLSAAQAFFQAHGWVNSYVCVDMIRDVRNYTTASEIERLIGEADVTVTIATPADAPDVLVFEAREFPNWLAAYEELVRLGSYDDILLARDSSGALLGVLAMYSPRSHPERADCQWKALLGDDIGGLGAVGVAADARGRNIGLALIARGSEILRERGVGNCWIGWTEAIGFYSKIGYQVWREFGMSAREIQHE
jgi:ribosomal protein S18 acetylase RimI-like enzyme